MDLKVYFYYFLLEFFEEIIQNFRKQKIKKKNKTSGLFWFLSIFPTRLQKILIPKLNIIVRKLMDKDGKYFYKKIRKFILKFIKQKFLEIS